MTLMVSDQAKQALGRDGVVGPFPLLHPERVTDLVKAHPTLDGKRNQHKHSAEVRAILADPNLAQAVRALCGGDLILWRTAFFYKKGGSAELGWHHDKHYQSATATTVRFDEMSQHFSVLIALNAITATSGQIEVIPGTHLEDARYRRDPRPIYLRPDDDHFLTDIPNALLETRRALDIPAAHFIVFHSALLHRSLAHPGGAPRLGLALRLARRDLGVPAELATLDDITAFDP
jgi:ectoine hydroxylase-related dioxygenase (phytanoyl-CoA dioxygenase family)